MKKRLAPGQTLPIVGRLVNFFPVEVKQQYCVFEQTAVPRAVATWGCSCPRAFSTIASKRLESGSASA